MGIHFGKSLVLSLTFLGFVGIFASSLAFSQARVVFDEPASEGRPITPAGSLVLDGRTWNPAVGSLPVAFVRSPDRGAKDGGGRYLISINSGYGIQFSASTNAGQQSISVLDLNAQPSPRVIQNVYFPAPQSAQVGAVFSSEADSSGSYTLYVSGGFENKIWLFRFHPGDPQPVSPASNGPDTKVTAPFISVAGFATEAGTPRYNSNQEPVYPLGIALSADGDTLYVANDLGDSLGIIRGLRYSRHLTRVGLSDGKSGHFVYPYGVKAWNPTNSRETQKVFVSCWATASVAAIDALHPERPVTFVAVGRHPTAMTFNSDRTRLYVANSDDDSVSVIDPASDRVVETISVHLSEKALPGDSPEGLALNANGNVLYVANAHTNAVAVVNLGPAEVKVARRRDDDKSSDDDDDKLLSRSRVAGFIPTGQYPSAVAFADGSLFVANGKGSGYESSSLVANNSGRAPNLPNDRFPVGTGSNRQGGEYDVALVAGTISQITPPDPQTLVSYTSQVMRNDGLIGSSEVRLFSGASPIHHVIYVIRENRTYDQVFGDLEKAGNGRTADGDASLAIFGDGTAASPANGATQQITPNAHALVERFGILDRFFVNSEASPDGHNWTDAAFSSDYVDKTYRWNYSSRGRTYDFQGTNRMPTMTAMSGLPPVLPVPATPDDLRKLIERYVPYLNGSRDVAEPQTLYLWDAAARAGLTYRTNGEFMSTISQAEIDAFNANRERDYPDTSATVVAFPLKKSLEDHFSATHREFDLYTPDSMTTDSYRASVQANSPKEALISSSNPDPHLRGYSRISAWLAEFRGYVDTINHGGKDAFPALNIVYLPNDHTNGMRVHMPTPQFYVADNDYALGLLVQEVSSSPYWKDTAIFVVEDDAQNGPDHVDAHRSPGLVISAYNRPGALVHEYHSTVSMVRTMEVLLGISPMNQLDAAAPPIDIFQAQPDLTPYEAILPKLALNNLLVQPAQDRETAMWIRNSERQDFTSEDMANPETLNRIIWFSVRRNDAPYPTIAQLPAFDVMRTKSEEEAAEQIDIDREIKAVLAKRISKSSARER